MVKFLSMNPTEYKLSSSKIKISYGTHPSPFGECIIGLKNPEKAICYFHFVSNRNGKGLADLKNQWPNAEIVQDQSGTEKFVRQIFSKDESDSLRVFVVGTQFQVKVWKALTTIPKGETVNYDFIAKAVDSPKAIQAIAKIVGSNKVGIVIPCHRTVSKSQGPKKTCWRTNKRPLLLEYERKQLEE